MSSVQPFILVLGYAADIGTTGGNYAGDSETVCLNQNISGTIFLKHYFRRCLFPEWSKPETYFTRDDCVSRTYPCNEPQNIYCWELKFISKNKMFIITFAYLVKKKKKESHIFGRYTPKAEIQLEHSSVGTDYLQLISIQVQGQCLIWRSMCLCNTE